MKKLILFSILSVLLYAAPGYTGGFLSKIVEMTGKAVKAERAERLLGITEALAAELLKTPAAVLAARPVLAALKEKWEAKEALRVPSGRLQAAERESRLQAAEAALVAALVAAIRAAPLPAGETILTLAGGDTLSIDDVYMAVKGFDEVFEEFAEYLLEATEYPLEAAEAEAAAPPSAPPQEAAAPPPSAPPQEAAAQEAAAPPVPSAPPLEEVQQAAAERLAAERLAALNALPPEGRGKLAANAAAERMAARAEEEGELRRSSSANLPKPAGDGNFSSY